LHEKVISQKMLVMLLSPQGRHGMPLLLPLCWNFLWLAKPQEVSNTATSAGAVTDKPDATAANTMQVYELALQMKWLCCCFHKLATACPCYCHRVGPSSG
jgi:hypothetical protein